MHQCTLSSSSFSSESIVSFRTHTSDIPQHLMRWPCHTFVIMKCFFYFTKIWQQIRKNLDSTDVCCMLGLHLCTQAQRRRHIPRLCHMLFWLYTALQMVQNSAPCQKSYHSQTSLSLAKWGPQLYLNILKLFFFHVILCVIFLHSTSRLSYTQVAGIKGVFLSNKVVENQVKTYITYNKGRDWHLLQAPTTDLQGNKVYCEQVSGPLTGIRI